MKLIKKIRRWFLFRSYKKFRNHNLEVLKKVSKLSDERQKEYEAAYERNKFATKLVTRKFIEQYFDLRIKDWEVEQLTTQEVETDNE